MNKAFLRSGKLESYLPMGENGQAVYISALQLRETLRLRGKGHISQCLAIPQPNETGDRIDWYSPIDGAVIPWSAASEEERTAAYQILEQNQADLLAFSQSEQAHSENKERQLFGALLGKTVQFPDENHIFIVNGQPIITFWGFVTANHALRIDPVACLKSQAPIQPKAAVVPPPIQEPVVIEKKRPWWRFLWWLLPLLLLLLAILFLRGCFSAPVIPVDNTNIANTEKPKEPEPTPEKPLKPVVPQTVITNGHTVTVPTTTGVVDSNGQPITDTVPNGSVDGTLPPVDGAVDGTQAGVTPTDQTPAVDPNAPVDPTKTDDTKTNGAEDNKGTDTGKTEDNKGADNKGAENNAANQPDPNSPPDLTPPVNPNNNTTPLTLPANALNSGSTDFLNGQWHAGAGIQDQKTGKPLSLSYQLDKGKGQVVMTRSDGVTCKAPVNAAVNQGGLNISNQGQANCSDGSNYRMPNIVCQPGSQNIADCKGQYDNNPAFPLSMKRENK